MKQLCPTCEWIVNELEKATEYWYKHYIFKDTKAKEIVDDFKRILDLLNKDKKNESVNPRI